MSDTHEETCRERVIRGIVDARKTGLKIRQKHEKIPFGEEFPEIAREPFYQDDNMTPPTFNLDISMSEGIKVKDLRELCIRCGDHPLALHFRSSILGYEDERDVRVNRGDLDILKEAAGTSSTVQVKEEITPLQDSSSSLQNDTSDSTSQSISQDTSPDETTTQSISEENPADE